MSTSTLSRPVGPEELALIEASGWRRFPPRLPDQPIFYPVCDEGYAREIAEHWNVPASGRGYVTRFAARTEVLARYERKVVGARRHAAVGGRPRWVDHPHRARNAPQAPPRRADEGAALFVPISS
ncbi:MAG: hypothetical protein Q8S73_00350 [Deltaproteobacteria bacterium]|nr:hypothetical protein [Myxococcales bacterium]MDP3212522.1 hypothetical protein [Deltaproteobacteria bacterium]